MMKMNIHEVKLNFSQLITQIANGKEVIITRSGRDFARITPIKKVVHKRSPGKDKDDAWVSEDFNESLPKELQKFFE